jgi:hypothetical protein
MELGKVDVIPLHFGASLNTVLVWSISAATIAGVLFRPRDWPEAVWACAGAALLVVCRLLPLSQAGAGIGKGTDVYLFLTGMMLLAELARRKGVFDWLASLAVTSARGSCARLFTLIYIVGPHARGLCGGSEGANEGASVSADLRFYSERGELRTTDFESGKPCRLWQEPSSAAAVAADFLLTFGVFHRDHLYRFAPGCRQGTGGQT